MPAPAGIIYQEVVGVPGCETRGIFYRGVFFGLGLGLGLAVVVLAIVLSRGVTVRVPGTSIAQTLSIQAQNELRENLPSILSQARSMVPDLVRPELRRRLGAAKMEFYGVSITVPPESLGGLETYLVGLVDETVGRVLSGMAAQLVSPAGKAPLEDVIAQALHRDLDGRTLRLCLFGPFTVPVRIVME
ncbi:MAG: hypothetical protein PWP12_22 [Bacillota bacterium]|jgi:hypothetical protein|nr:hypothetical protein [Bacillota bacterium]MDK2881711.1 hypothetical protein [Bacillota bacterium]MDK2959838.1 hypothetical protein [Bacillota bacterium]